MDIEECIEKRYLLREKPSKDLIDKELAEADYDLSKATKRFAEQDFKWAIVASYYAMFHSARAVLFKLGYREKRHFAVAVVLENLNKEGLLEKRFVDSFKAAMSSREDADYNYTYSEDSARHIVGIAEGFVKQMRLLPR